MNDLKIQTIILRLISSSGSIGSSPGGIIFSGFRPALTFFEIFHFFDIFTDPISSLITDDCNFYLSNFTPMLADGLREDYRP